MGFLILILLFIVVVAMLMGWKPKSKNWMSGPVKSAHIIRMERGLLTGLGNRRPWPHGRRVKKYL